MTTATTIKAVPATTAIIVQNGKMHPKESLSSLRIGIPKTQYQCTLDLRLNTELKPEHHHFTKIVFGYIFLSLPFILYP